MAVLCVFRKKQQKTVEGKGCQFFFCQAMRKNGGRNLWVFIQYIQKALLDVVKDLLPLFQGGIYPAFRENFLMGLEKAGILFSSFF